MGTQALFTDQPTAKIVVQHLSPDVYTWLQEHNFLLDYRTPITLREFMKTAPYIHPLTSALTAYDMDIWDALFDHIFEQNPTVEEVRIHCLDRASLRIFQIVKNTNDEYVSILRTPPIPTPYFSQVPDSASDSHYYFQYNFYCEHWRTTPRSVLRLFKPYLPPVEAEAEAETPVRSKSI
jgi:hypothetical protein